ncbi:MAG: insulinase family protein [Proteobacteria bacterium]|nr:insulinase family protein [Pseudomonadota bacterium]
MSVDFQMPHRPEASIADLRRSLTEGMFSSILGARLAIIAKRAKSSWTGAGVGFGSNLRPVDELSLSATAKDGKLLDAIGDLAGELARVRQHGFSTEEIDEARAATLRRFEEGVREVDTRDSRDTASEILRNFLTHEYMIGAVRELELTQAVLPTITNAQLVEIAKLATDTGRVVTIQAPPKGDVPTEAAIAAKLAEGAARQMPAWEATDLTQPLITADPTPGKITAEKTLGNDVVQWSLSNGATVLLKHTDFKKDEVVVVGVSNGGTSQVANAQYPQALFAGAIVNTMGIGNYGPDELEKKLAGKKAGVAVSIDGEQERVEGTASPSDVLPMMQLVHGAFVEPHVDASAFEAWKLQQLQLAKLIGANTQAIFIIGAFDALFDHHPRIPLPFPTEQRIAAIKLDQAVAQYRARMANAADFGFVIVGAFDVAAMRPLVEKYLASLPATKAKHETVKDVGLKPHQGTLNKTVRAGDENKAMSMIVASAIVPWSLTVEADAEILQGVLNIELLEVLREKLGGTYSVSVQSQADRSPPQRAMTLAVFESDPTRATAMQAEAWKTLDALATTPVKDDTLAKVKEQLVKEHGANLLENAYWTGLLERVVRYGDDLATLVAIDRVTARVTAANVKKIAAQFVGKTNRVTVTLLPEVPAAKPDAKPAPKK